MKISIVTAVYNRKDTIEQAIKSVQRQSYRNIEHLIQDGGSNDGTLGIIKDNSDARTFVESAPDGGIYDAINRGISRAQGDVVGLLHSDDFLASADVISKIAVAMKDPSIDGVYGDLQYVSAKDTSKVIRHWRAGSFREKDLKRGWMPPHPTVYLRREVFDRLGMYDKRYKISADYDAMLRFLGVGQVQLAYVPEVLVRMRTGGASNQSLVHLIRKSMEDYTALRTNKVGGFRTLIGKNISKFSQFKKMR
jgi:glycosyltransferase involved in cell wall biosynthesis